MGWTIWLKLFENKLAFAGSSILKKTIISAVEGLLVDLFSWGSKLFRASFKSFWRAVEFTLAHRVPFEVVLYYRFSGGCSGNVGPRA